MFSLLFGCSSKEEYQMSTSEGGRIYRLNKKTGAISLIEGYNITNLQEPKASESSSNIDSLLFKSKEWQELTLPTNPNLKVNLKTIWRDGKLFYILYVAPVTDKLKEARTGFLSNNKFTLQLTDANGFYLLEIPIPLKSMTEIVDNNGNATYLSANDNVSCTSETYLALASWTCSWNL